jgi:hypothetical protein
MNTKARGKKKIITRTEVLANYKTFFGLEEMGTGEDDQLMIDWAESLIEDLQSDGKIIPSTESGLHISDVSVPKGTVCVWMPNGKRPPCKTNHLLKCENCAYNKQTER